MYLWIYGYILLVLFLWRTLDHQLHPALSLLCFMALVLTEFPVIAIPSQSKCTFSSGLIK